MKSGQECQHSFENCCCSTLPVDCMPIIPYSECPLGGWKLLDLPYSSCGVTFFFLILLTHSFHRGQICPSYLNPHTPFVHSRADEELFEVERCAECKLSPLYSYECGHLYHTVAVSMLLELGWHVDKGICSVTIVKLHQVNICSMKWHKKHLVLSSCFELYNFPTAHKWSIQSS